MVRKMALVPAEMASQFTLQQHLPGTQTLTQLSRLDERMKAILEDRSLPEDVKYKHYYNVLHQYEALQDQMERAPIPVTVAAEKPRREEGIVTLPVSESDLLEAVPQTQRRGTRLLLKYIKDNPDLKWNEANELVYKGDRIPHSNIFDLVSDISRDRKNQNPAIGWRELAEALQGQNVPESAIGNKQRWQYMADLDEKPPATPSPLGRRRRQRIPSRSPIRTRRSGQGQRGRGRRRMIRWETLY